MTARAVTRVLGECLGVAPGERVALLVDERSDPAVVEVLGAGLEERSARSEVLEVPVPGLPGEEPPAATAELLLEVDAAIELTSLFIGSSRARRNASAVGTRYLAMPGVVLDTFRDGGPLDVDFAGLRSTAEAVGREWTSANEFHLTNPAGTDLRGSVVGRPGRVLHGIAADAGAYMAPPDVEAGTAPREGTTNGVVVIDGDLLFMGVGPLREPVVLTIVDGELVDAEGPEVDRLLDMIERCADPRMSNLAEVSLGLNPAGTVCEVAMETESALGTAHVALGNSIAYGGIVDARAHLDCVLRDVTLALDGRTVMSRGQLVGDG
jgi:leucyl aminopeptidase (aminopeptidase T)